MKNETFKNIFLSAITICLTTNFLVKTEDKPDTWVNVFLHGIISITPVLSWGTMKQIENNKIENTVYESYVNNARRNSFFCKNQIKQGLGLKKIDTLRTDADDGCPATAKIFDLQYSWANPNKKIENYYYTFGWSGLMNSQKMYSDAKKLYVSLSKKIKKLQKDGTNPKTRLIGYSNGGAVILKIADVIQKEKLDRIFEINELILLGMPVMQDKDYLINDPIFKKIYHFYSGSDRIQILDFSHPNKLFSKRKFRSRKNFKLPDKLLQVRLEILRDIDMKSGWAFNKKIVKKNYKPSRHSSTIRKSFPGHCEWWFFGWTSKFYRSKFALAPLPVVAIIPTIVDALNNTEFTPNKTKIFGNQIDLRIRPFEESMRINTNKPLKFLTEEKIKILKNTAKEFPFKKITRKEYNQNVKHELTKAKEQVKLYLQENPKKKKWRRKRKTSQS